MKGVDFMICYIIIKDEYKDDEEAIQEIKEVLSDILNTLSQWFKYDFDNLLNSYHIIEQDTVDFSALRYPLNESQMFERVALEEYKEYLNSKAIMIKVNRIPKYLCDEFNVPYVPLYMYDIYIQRRLKYLNEYIAKYIITDT
jgi:hypothetical protein